ncbi:hypothetical protein GUJ93_ZPchr0011g28145 [Zizania palustris]|uniref:Uncharacterized protein n=1 Tax=Zizania palustris TaxID=103762 RepID=A0A8J5WH26_ZIZPA|nr:hypothetical protein GUJ93_ZPchr0011g28145 [Zizania palustris]
MPPKRSLATDPPRRSPRTNGAGPSTIPQTPEVVIKPRAPRVPLAAPSMLRTDYPSSQDPEVPFEGSEDLPEDVATQKVPFDPKFKASKLHKYSGGSDPGEFSRSYALAIEASEGVQNTMAKYFPLALEGVALLFLVSKARINQVMGAAEKEVPVLDSDDASNVIRFLWKESKEKFSKMFSLNSSQGFSNTIPEINSVQNNTKANDSTQ